MDLSAFLLSRLQFAFAISFHIGFSSSMIELLAWLTTIEALYLTTGRPTYRIVLGFCLKMTAVTRSLVSPDLLPAVPGTERKARYESLTIVDSIAWCRNLLPHLEILRTLTRSALHPTCSTTHLGLAGALKEIANHLADEVAGRPAAARPETGGFFILNWSFRRRERSDLRWTPVPPRLTFRRTGLARLGFDTRRGDPTCRSSSCWRNSAVLPRALTPLRHMQQRGARMARGANANCWVLSRPPSPIFVHPRSVMFRPARNDRARRPRRSNFDLSCAWMEVGTG